MGVAQQLVDALLNNKNDQVGQLLGKIDPYNVNEAAIFAGRSVTFTPSGTYTPLYAACYVNNVAAVAKLLSIPYVDVNATLKLLLDYPGVEVNARNKYGRTAILYAAGNNSSEALKLLLDHPGVDLDVTDNDGSGLEEMVERNSIIKQTEKSRCLEMIAEKRRRLEEPAGAAADLTEKYEVGISLEEVRINDRQQYFDKMEKLKVEIEAQEEKVRKNTELKRELERKDEEDRQHLANLKEILQFELANDLQKMDLYPDNDASANLKAARETLECPVCMEMMRPPMQIWMCSASHLVCEPCKDKLSVYPGRFCPTCQTERVTLRAHMAEKFAMTLFRI